MTISGIPLSTFLAFVVTGASIVVAIIWALSDSAGGD
jgi:hypothetical protein